MTADEKNQGIIQVAMGAAMYPMAEIHTKEEARWEFHDAIHAKYPQHWEDGGDGADAHRFGDTFGMDKQDCV